MKRLLTLFFALAVAFSLTMPAFSREAGAGQEAPKAEKGEKKGKKKGGGKKEGVKKGSKKGKKEGMEKKEGESK